MDLPCTYEQFRDCVRDIGAVNRWTFAYRPTLNFLNTAVRSTPPRDPLRVLDLGSGGGDTLRRIARWSARRSIPLSLLGLDTNPHATRAAEEFTDHHPNSASITFRTADALTDPEAQQTDLVVSSLVMHHMRDADIVALLRWMERTATRGWFISDLLRSARAYRFFALFSRLMRWHGFVQHDGLVSIRRGFRSADWLRLLAEAGIPPGAVALSQPVPGRLCLTRLR